MDIVSVEGGGPLAEYKVYFLDGAGRVAAPPLTFEAPSDEVAAKLAEGWRDGRVIELWCGTRKVRT